MSPFSLRTALCLCVLAACAAMAVARVDVAAVDAVNAGLQAASWTRVVGGVAAAALLCAALCAWERSRLETLSGGLPGPKSSSLPPFIGGVVQMVRDPATFWHDAFARGPLSWTALGTKLVVVVSDAAAARSVFTRCSDRLPLCLSLNSKPLLGK